MENQSKSFFPKLMSILFIAMGIFLGFYAFFANATTWSIGSNSWNNSSYLDSSFWSYGPSTGDIITALYGSGDEWTAYTKWWSGYTSGSCLAAGMQVEYFTWGTSILPLSLSGNTIYILSSGTYITTGTLSLDNNCIAIVGTGKIYIYSTWSLATLIYASWTQNNIIDNVIIDGIYDGQSSIHSPNQFWILLDYAAQNITINQLQSMNNAGDGMSILNNSQNILVNNSLLFNNGRAGIDVNNAALFSNNVNINNTILFNNENWLNLVRSTENIINNVYSFNNNTFWIKLIEATNNIFQWVNSYNNWDYWFDLDTISIGNQFFGGLNVFNNHWGIWLNENIIWTNGSDQYLTWGTEIYLSTLWRGSGILSTVGTTSRAYLINPVNADNIYLHNRNSWLNIRGPQVRTGKLPVSYSFGSSIVQQIQPVMFSWTSIITWWSYNIIKYIGSQITYLSWTITISGGAYNSTSWTTISLTAVNPTQYRIFGPDIISEVIGTYVTGSVTQSITFSWTDWLKTAFVQFRNGTDRATHYATSTILDTTYPLFECHDISLSIPMTTWGYYTFSWVTIVATDVNLSGATLSGLNGNTYYSGNFNLGYNTLLNDWTYKLIVSDYAGNSTGITFTIDTTAPSVTGIYPTSGINITGTNNIAFTRTGLDAHMSGYTIQVTGTNTYTCTTNQTGCTINYMNNGNYTWYVIATDRAGNTWTSIPRPFMITTPFSGSATITGTNIIYTIYPYTNNVVWLRLWANQPYNYVVTWTDLVSGITGGFISWSIIVYSQLTWADGAKTINVIFSNFTGDTISKTISVHLDRTALAPTPVIPASGSAISGAFNLAWSGVGDAVGISGYQYFIATTWTIGTWVVKSAFTTSSITSASIANMEIWLDGTYYRYVKSIDRLGNVWTSVVYPFSYSGTIDTTPDSFSFTSITDARINRVYASNIVTITGLSTPVIASINRWALYISGHLVTGTTWYVQNWWTVKIELVSSDEYDDEITSTLTVGTRSATFHVITMQEDEDTYNYDDIETDLSNTEKLMIFSIFETLRDLYAGDKEEEFFNTLMVMLENKMDDLDENDTEYSSLKYLYDLAKQYYEQGDFSGDNVDNTPWIINGIYTAPNGKRYTITYDSSKQRFTSTNFVTPKYFPTLDTLKYIIDINNPVGTQYLNAKSILARFKNASIDGTWQTSPYTAPNHKVFYFFKSIDGRYSSYTFTTERYFDSLEAVKEYIYNSNR